MTSSGHHQHAHQSSHRVGARRLGGPQLGVLVAVLLLGALVDFLANGVLKIRFAVVYVPVYLGLASILFTAFHDKRWHTRWEWLARPAAALFLAGALLGHLLLVGHERVLTYTMAVATPAPLTFKSPDWPQILVVVSKPVEAALARTGLNATVPVVVSEVRDYGCIQKFLVDTVDGVDVRYDKDATWTWKTDHNATTPESAGPGSEDSELPWCQIHFF